MSGAEIRHRIAEGLYSQAQRCGFLVTDDAPIGERCAAALTWLNETSLVERTPYVDAAGEILRGHVRLFEHSETDLGNLARWNVDPGTGRVAPWSFGPTIDYRNVELVGDIKYLWEPNRHLHFVTLAQAHKVSGDARYLDGLACQLGSWLDQCPYLRGPNWSSSLELGIRLINWANAWQLVGGWDSELFANTGGEELKDRWLQSIYQHCHFIRRRFSRYSSANNHLIGEAAGLFVATTVWPYWDDMPKWQAVAKEELEREALLQNAPDGVNREQTTAYQQFVFDFLLIAGLVGRRAGIEFSEAYWKRLEAMLEFVVAVMDAGGNVPMIGDADDGFVVRLSQEEDFCPYRSQLATGTILFDRPDFAAKAGKLDDKTRWLLGDEITAKWDELSGQQPGEPTRRAFPEGGYYVLGTAWNTPEEIRLVADAGPLGYLSIAAHGHADALAYTLSVGGREFLIDPGTYAYHTKKRWRDYFRGTSAHNTVRIDGENQSVIGGNFMWMTAAEARAELWEAGEAEDRLIGVHDGYERLSDPVTHRREFRLLKPERKVTIEDTLSCRGSHLLELFAHFSEDCEVTLDGGTVRATNAGVCIEMVVEGVGLEIECFHGDDVRPSGWVSRHYDVKVPATTVVWRTTIDGSSRLCTQIDCAPAGNAN